MKFKQIILILGFVGLVIAILLNQEEFIKFWHLLAHVRLYILALVLLVQVFSYYLNALYYASILKAFKYTVEIKRLFEGALAANFVNYVFPTAGMGGAAFLSKVLKPEVPRAQGFLVQIVRYVLGSIATASFIPVAILLLVLGGHTNGKIIGITIATSSVIIVTGFAIFFMVKREAFVRRNLSRLEKRFKFLQKSNVGQFADEFYEGFYVIFKDLRTMVIPFIWSLAYIAVELFTLYLAFLAFGRVVNPGIVMLGYILANIASFFGGTIISFGAFEVSLAGTLVALGEPLALALSVTTVYRVMNMVIGLPPGFVYYRKYLAKAA